MKRPNTNQITKLLTDTVVPSIKQVIGPKKNSWIVIFDREYKGFRGELVTEMRCAIVRWDEESKCLRVSSNMIV